MRIKIPGHSGCRVEILAGMVLKQATTASSAGRLQVQREKQQHFKTAINQIRVPKVLYYNAMSFAMEYLNMLDCIEFFEVAAPKTIESRVNLLVQLILEELKAAKLREVNSNLFLEKLDTIQKRVPEGIWQEYYAYHVSKIRECLSRRLVIPLGQCHGDLTFSNIMFSLEAAEIGLIDFLDSFLESPIVDIIKMRQDTRYNWTSRWCGRPHDTVRVSIVMFWLDKLLESAFGQIIHASYFRVVEMLNYFRIAPYAQSIAEHQYLSEVLRVL